MASVSLDLNRYRWHQDDKVPGRFLREPVGGELIEDVWNMIHYGEQNLFLGLYLELTEPLSPSDFLAHARDAWISLRWEVPAIATQSLHIMEEGRPLPRSYMVYDPAKSAADVAAWAEETVILVEGYKDLDDLRYAVGQEPVPAKDLSPWTYAYVLPMSPKSFGVLIRTSHVPFDGTGLKNTGTKLLTHLSNYIADPSYKKSELERLKWGSELEAANLLPAFLDIIDIHEPQAAVKDAQGNIIQEARPGEKLAGPLFDTTFEECMQGLVKGAALSHPFKSIINPPFDVGKQKPKTRRLYHTFSVEESTKIKASGAPTTSRPEKLTINHLVHATVSLLPILDNPPPKDSDAVVFYFGLIDTRKKLIEQYQGPGAHPGYCCAMTPVQVPVSLFHQVPSGDRKALVLEYAKAIRSEYKRQEAIPCFLSISGLQVETMMQGPPPPAWCGPWYAGDGRGSVHLTPTYTVKGQKVLEITDFFIGLNKCDPGPFFRATEWNGRIMLSVDFNELAVQTETVQNWMNLWVELLLAL